MPFGWCQSIGGSTASEWAGICSIASKFGCSSETLRLWVRRAEGDQGLRLEFPPCAGHLVYAAV